LDVGPSAQADGLFLFGPAKNRRPDIQKNQSRAWAGRLSESLIEHWCEQIRTAAQAGQRLRPQGGGSKNFHGAPLGDAQVLNTAALAGIVSYEPSELVVTARCGTPLASSKRHWPKRASACRLSRRILARATVGGMVAAG
jgi:glycolate oxidase FAD binding subunit